MSRAGEMVIAMKSESGNQQIFVDGLRGEISLVQGDMTATFRCRVTAASVAASAYPLLTTIVRSKPQKLIFNGIRHVLL